MLCFCLVPGLVWGYSGGDGSLESPFIISTPSDLQRLASTPSDWDEAYALSQDVNMVRVEMSPIGTHDIPFTGSFDGQYHKIQHVYIHDAGLQWGGLGLFGVVDGSEENTQISRVVLRNTRIQSNKER